MTRTDDLAFPLEHAHLVLYLTPAAKTTSTLTRMPTRSGEQFLLRTGSTVSQSLHLEPQKKNDVNTACDLVTGRRFLPRQTFEAAAVQTSTGEAVTQLSKRQQLGTGKHRGEGRWGAKESTGGHGVQECSWWHTDQDHDLPK